MQEPESKKSNSFLVFAIIATLIGLSFFGLDKLTKSQKENVIPLQKQGDENLKEALISGTAGKTDLPKYEDTTKSGSEQEKPVELKPNVAVKQKGTMPAMQIKSGINYKAVLKTTEGNIVIELDTKNTPITANNFISLSKDNFYNETIFHRVIKGFMIQGGDPSGTGAGGPGYKFDDEPFTGEYVRGTVAMANAGPNTNGSQFFIMHEAQALPKAYVIFGKVVEGMDTVDKIANAPVYIGPNGENSKPISPAQINSVEIVETPESPEN